MTHEPGQAAPRHASAWRSRRAWCFLLGVVLIGLATDLGSKWLAFRAVADDPVTIRRADVLATRPLGRLIPPHAPVVVVPGGLEITLVLNPGAVFGMGAGQRTFFIVFTLAAIGFALWMFASWTRPRDALGQAALGLLLSGALGNLYDRVAYACVRDFIHPLPGVLLPFGWRLPGGERELWPYVSNLADLYLILGIGAMVLHSVRGSKRPAVAPPA